MRQMKIAVSSPAQLNAVIAKLVGLGYGISSNRYRSLAEINAANDYDHVFAYADGMITFGHDRGQWGSRGTSWTRSELPEVRAVDLLDPSKCESCGHDLDDVNHGCRDCL